MKFVFDWHSQDSRAAGPLEVANTVTAQYGTGGYDPAYTLKIRSGCEGGGKGALVQTDLSATLATNNDQTLFAPARENCLPINMMLATRCKALGRGTGLGVGETGDPQYTITAGHEHAVAYKVEEQEEVKSGSAVH